MEQEFQSVLYLFKKIIKWTSLMLSPLFFIFFLISAVVISFSFAQQQTRQAEVIWNSQLRVVNVSRNVLELEPTISRLAKEYGILEYVPALMAITQVESGGVGGDPMQSSESQGYPPNTIKDRTESVRAGVSHFKNSLELSQKYDVDFWTTVAAYNFGTNYIRFISENGKKHSLELAEKYSREVVAPSLGNHTGTIYSYVTDVSKKYGKTYLYVDGGNYYYAERVKEHLSQVNMSEGIVSSGQYIPPLASPNYVITSDYGEYRDLIINGKPFSNIHRGVDLVYADGRPQGDILSIDSGEVVYASQDSSGSLTIIIKHKENLYSHYMHLSAIYVSKGQTVRQGDVIGQMGNTGMSTGEHLHFGIGRQPFTDYFSPHDILKLK